MNKYRAYDTKQNMYLNGEDVDINGYGDLTAYGADEDGSHVTQLLNTRSPRFIIEQYTGLKDKNGVEIAVGDIVKMETGDEPIITTVKFRVDKLFSGFGFEALMGDDIYESIGRPEVIGNIHHNPELLDARVKQ